MPKVINVRWLYKDINTEPQKGLDYVYCGRGSKWGNPFKISRREGLTRGMVIELYKDYIDTKIANRELDVAELKGKNLGCFCAPLACHCDYLMKLANEDEDEQDGEFIQDTTALSGW